MEDMFENQEKKEEQDSNIVESSQKMEEQDPNILENSQTVEEQDSNIVDISKKRKFETYRLPLILVCSFLLPVIIYFIILMILGVWPNGTKTVVFMDMKDEYIEYLASLRQALNHDSTFFFSWSHSLGGDMLGLYAFYSGGMLALFSFLFPVMKLYHAAMFIELIAVGLSGLCIAIFFEWGFQEKKGNFATVAFSICYALMSYNMVYSNCFFWLDGCIFLPLVLLGIEKIFKGEKGFFFYLMLMLSMINNYYTAYMICIFSVLYVGFRMVCLYKKYRRNHTNKKELLYAFGKYAFMAVLAAMTAFPVLYAVVKNLQGGKLSVDTDWTKEKYYFDFPAVFQKLFTGYYDSIAKDNTLPSLFCGMAVLFFVVLYFFQKNRKKEEKLAAGGILVLFFLSFWNVSLDKVWHGFQQPHWFPWRYTFLFSFFLIFLSYQAFNRLKFSKKRMKYQAAAFLLVFCVFDLGYNAYVCLNGLDKQFGYMDISEYIDFYKKTEPMVKEAKKMDDGLFRMDKDYEFSKNDSFLFGYNGMTHYSSTYNGNVNNLTPKLGMAQSWYWNSGYGATHLVDSLLGVRYRILEQKPPEIFEQIKKGKKASLYRNNQALSFVFAADKNCPDLTELNENIFENQNRYLSALIGKETKCFTQEEFTKNDFSTGPTLVLQTKNNDPLYLYLSSNDPRQGDLYVNGKFISHCFSATTKCAIYLGTFSKGTLISIEIRNTDCNYDEAYIYSYNVELAKKALETLKKNELQVSSHGEASLKGTITVGKDQIVASSIPYSEEFTVFLDGKKVSCETMLNTFLCFRASAGKHNVEIRFAPSSFRSGIKASLLAIILLLCYLFDVKRFLKIKKKNEEGAAL